MLPFPIISNTNIVPVPSALIKQIASTYSMLFVLYDNGELYVKGTDSTSNSGTGLTNQKITTWTLSATNVKMIRTAQYASLIIKNDGSMFHVGRYAYIQNTTSTATYGTWTDVTSTFSASFSPSLIVDYKLSEYCTMILLSTGEVWGVGGTIGNQRLGGNAISKNLSILSGAPTDAIKIELNALRSAIVSASGKIYMAGSNYLGACGGSSSSGATSTDYQQSYANRTPSNTFVDDVWLAYNNSFFLGHTTGTETSENNVIWYSGSTDSGSTPTQAYTFTKWTQATGTTGLIRYPEHDESMIYNLNIGLKSTTGIWSNGYATSGVRGISNTTSSTTWVNDTVGFQNVAPSSVKYLAFMSAGTANTVSFMVLGYNLYYSGTASTQLGYVNSTTYTRITDLPY